MTLDILLVNPIFLNLNQAERDLMSPYFPLGLLYLAAFLRERGFSVDIFDGTFMEVLQDFDQHLEELKPGAVGISVVRPNKQTAMILARKAKEAGAAVIIGGPDPTSNPAEYLAEPYIDFVVHHEGEITLTELLGNLNNLAADPNLIVDMPGLAYRSLEGSIVINPRRPYILNLDELPAPARDLVDLDKYLDTWRTLNGYASLSISISRGCPYGCAWCQDSVHGPGHRRRSPQSVVAEVRELMGRYEIDRLRLVDDVDGIDREWFDEWAECSQKEGVELPFEALNDLKRKDIPMLDVQDTL